jgi:ketosteroid isomerase-like protein
MQHRIGSFAMVLALASGIVCFGQDEKAMATAQRLHNELDKLEQTGNLERQASYFHDNVVRMDAFRPMSKGKSQWLGLQQNLRAKNTYKVETIKTTVVNAWQEGDRLYEYGTAEMRIQTPAGGAADPINYFAVWRINPATRATPQIDFIIWNTAKPVQQLNTLSRAQVK